MPMTHAAALLRLRRRGDRAASLVEYALLIALIAIVCIVAVIFFGEETSESFSSTSKSIEEATD